MYILLGSGADNPEGRYESQENFFSWIKVASLRTTSAGKKF